MGGTAFKKLAEVCERLAETPGRMDKVSLIVRLLKELNPREAGRAARLMIGRPLPESSEERLDISFASLEEAETGQATLIQEPLTIDEVVEVLEEIAGLSGSGSREKKRVILSGLMARMSTLERKWLTKAIIGEMQHGVNEGVLLEAVAELAGVPLTLVQRANMLLGDVGGLVELASSSGRDALTSVKLTLFRPVKPMLAEMGQDLGEALREAGGHAALEYKLDGARVQIHVKDGEVRIYSRRLSDVSASLPDVVEQVKEGVRTREAVLDGETIAVDKKGRPLPFQALLRRFRRIRGVEEKAEEIPLRLYLFDILYLNGEEVLDLPYRERWEKLRSVSEPSLLAPRIITGSLREAEEFLRASLDAGHEGVMVKRLDSLYIPGKRERLWLKIKPAETLDLVIVAADWGYGRRTGWLSNYHLAAYNSETGGYEVVGKTFKGLTDEEFEWMTKRLLELKLSDDGYTVRVKPRIVVEVAYNEIQRSPKYGSGLALRFARITRIRTDKRPEEADTVQRVKELYFKQFKRKGTPF